MLSPHIYNDMPMLVEPNSPFHPPPPGVSQGGQPGGFYDAFPGAAAAQQQNVAWPPSTFQGTPFPHSAGNFTNANGWPGPASAPLQPPPNSAPPGGWPFGAQQPHYYPQFNNTPSLSWGAPTPAGSYGPPQTPTSGNPPPFGFGGGGYTPWSAPAFGGAPGQEPQGFAQPITPGGFYGAPANGNNNNGNNNMLSVGWGEPTKEEKRRKRTTSMKRSSSEGPSKEAARKSHMQRSNSFGNLASSPFGNPSVFGYAPFPGYYPAAPPPYMVQGGGGDVYGPKNLARRPRDWRADYTPRGGLSSYLPNITGRSRSDVQEYTDPTRRSLHPLLQYLPNRPPIDHDLRSNPMTVSPLFMNLNRPHNNIDFAQLATNPAASFMRLYHPSLPWYIDVRQSHPNGVTVYDVLAQMYRQTMSPITGRHFWNEELSGDDRKGVTLAFQERCKGDSAEVNRGVVQVDFLGVKVIFEGLLRGKGGMWEIKTRRLPDH